MTAATFTKDPNERLDYELDFARWLPDGDTIESATATVASTGVEEGATTASVDAISFTDMTVRVWMLGGEAGQVATVIVSVTTAAGRIKEQPFRLRIKESA